MTSLITDLNRKIRLHLEAKSAINSSDNLSSTKSSLNLYVKTLDFLLNKTNLSPSIISYSPIYYSIISLPFINIKTLIYQQNGNLLFYYKKMKNELIRIKIKEKEKKKKVAEWIGRLMSFDAFKEKVGEDEILQILKDCLKDLNKFEGKITKVNKETENLKIFVEKELSKIKLTSYEPSLIKRIWFPSLIILVSSFSFVKIIFNNKITLKKFIKNSVSTFIDFTQNWIFEPIKRIYKTIRHEEQLQLLSSKSSLSEDLHCLEQMVSNYASTVTKSNFTTLTISSDTEFNKNMAILLSNYTNEIKNPIKNLVFSDLLQLLLIQIQKSKLDLEVTLSALEKLLQSNELNFAFLAFIPSLFVLYLAFSWFGKIIKNNGSGSKAFKKALRNGLRKIEVLLDKSSDGDDTDYVLYGMVVLECEQLRVEASNSRYLTKNDYDELMEDLRELESCELTNDQKRLVCERVFRYYLMK